MASLQVVKTVYASPSRVNFQLDSRKVSLGTFWSSWYHRIIHFIPFHSDTVANIYLGSGDNTCLSRYLFRNRWLRLHFWCCGKGPIVAFTFLNLISARILNTLACNSFSLRILTCLQFIMLQEMIVFLGFSGLDWNGPLLLCNSQCTWWGSISQGKGTRWLQFQW